MSNRYRPKIDKFFWWMLVIVNAVCLSLLVISIFDPISFFCTVPIALFCNYFFISPLFGYAELREDHIFIKYGLILKKSIPYKRLRSVEIKRGIISEAVIDLKLSLEHIVIKYNTFDFTIISVKENQFLIEELREKMKQYKTALFDF